MNDDNVRFHIEKSAKTIILLGLIFFFGGLVFWTALLIFKPELYVIWWIWGPNIIACFIITKTIWSIWKQRNNYVMIGDSQISLNTPENNIVSMKWNDIIEIRENNILERMILRDKFNNVLNLEYQLENMTGLISMLIRRLPHLVERYTELDKFRRTKQVHVFFAACILFMLSFAVFSIDYGSLFAGAFFGLFSCLPLFVFLIEFTGIQLLDGSIRIRYPLWNRTIQFSQIEKYYIVQFNAGQGKSSPTVIFKLKNNKSIRLNSVREGSIALFSAIQHRIAGGAS